jgi:hypothetical protein
MESSYCGRSSSKSRAADNSSSMTDAEFLRAFEDTTLEPFHHRDHLRVTWLYLRQFGEAETRERLGPAILRYAAARGVAEKYHQTITLAWIRLVGHASETAADFDAILIAHPHLLDKNLLNRYYSPAVLQSPEARRRWVEPDREQLVSPAPRTRS